MSSGKATGTGETGCLSWKGGRQGLRASLPELLPLSRSALETLSDPGALSEKEGRLLLAALVKAYVQRKTNELEQEEEQEETEDSR